MKRICGIVALVFVGIVAWRIGEALSSDAISMAVGVLFGILGSIPTALLVLASRGNLRNDRTPAASPRPPANVTNNITNNVTINNNIMMPVVVEKIMESVGADTAIPNPDGGYDLYQGNQYIDSLYKEQRSLTAS